MIRRCVTSVLVILIGLIAVAGCRSAGISAAKPVDDASITASVKANLVGDKAANLTRVDVDTNNGTVYLNGSVASAEQKARAEQLVWQARGVKNVVNNLQISKQ